MSLRDVLRSGRDNEQDHREQFHDAADVLRRFHVRARLGDAAGFGAVSVWALLPTRTAHSVSKTNVLPRRGEHRAETLRARSLSTGVRSIDV